LERDIKKEILKILGRRPLSIPDLSEGMGIPEYEIDRSISLLIKEGLVRKKIFGNSIYYELTKIRL